jgi:transposase
MQRQVVSEENRNSIVRAVLNLQISYQDVAVLYSLSVSTVKSIIYKFLRTGNIEDGRIHNKSKSKLNDTHRVFLCQSVMDDPSCTQQSLTVDIADNFDVEVDRSTVSRAFKHENITLKTLATVPYARNSVAVKQQRKEFSEFLVAHVGLHHNEDLLHIFDRKLVYVDETGFNVNLRRKQGWSFKGERAFISTASDRGGNISSFGALSPTNGFWLSSKVGAFNQASFLSELQCYIDSRAGDIPEGGLIFLMDNVPFHHGHDIRYFLEGAGHHLMFIPPYSPFLNAIENAFSKLKSAVSAKLARINRRNAALTDMISECEVLITVSDCLAYHRNVLSYIPQCLALENINA